MSTNEADRADLESKDKDSLIQIATALGGKPSSRSRKSEIIDLILELANEDSNEGSQSQDEKEQPQSKSKGYSACLLYTSDAADE